MPAFDLLIRHGTVVTPDGVVPADVAVADGRVAAVGPELAGTAREEIDARGLHLFPGGVDTHVHFNEPGRTGWEGWATGSRALAAGGGAVAVEMPLNASPPTLDGPAVAAKRAAAEASSVVDFALWGGLTPTNLDRLEELAESGVVGFKAFMSGSGIDECPAADDDTLVAGMATAARLGLPVAVHAEDDAITRALAEEARAAGQTGWWDYHRSRPVVAETAAIGRALALAAATGCALHVVHVSSGAGLALVAEARARGQDVSAETCPHYLVLTEEDLERIGAAAKCAPPLRPAAEVGALWAAIAAGGVQTVGSDHSPAPADLKEGDDAFAVWGGIAGVQSTLPLLLTEGHHRRGVSLPRLADLLAATPAARVRLPGKGRIEPGRDADFALVDLDREWRLGRDDLLDRHRLSPYVGRRFLGAVRRTILRGRTVYADGKIVADAGGRFLRPAPRS